MPLTSLIWISISNTSSYSNTKSFSPFYSNTTAFSLTPESLAHHFFLTHTLLSSHLHLIQWVWVPGTGCNSKPQFSALTTSIVFMCLCLVSFSTLNPITTKPSSPLNLEKECSLLFLQKIISPYRLDDSATCYHPNLTGFISASFIWQTFLPHICLKQIH